MRRIAGAAKKMTEVQEEPATDRREEVREKLLSDIKELARLLPGLEQDHTKASEELSKAEVIRRHVARNPEKFSPHERENIFERVQGLAVRKQSLETTLEAAPPRQPGRPRARSPARPVNRRRGEGTAPPPGAAGAVL